MSDLPAVALLPAQPLSPEQPLRATPRFPDVDYCRAPIALRVDGGVDLGTVECCLAIHHEALGADPDDPLGMDHEIPSVTWSTAGGLLELVDAATGCPVATYSCEVRPHDHPGRGHTVRTPRWPARHHVPA